MIYLVRHGETEWSAARRLTGRTDVPLAAAGRGQATALAPTLAGIDPDAVLTSPLRRARETCELAGFGERAVIDDRLQEWDYGSVEGKVTDEIRVGTPGWSIWTDPPADAEPLESICARVDAVVGELADRDQVSIVFAHAHLLRILAARWCGLAPESGRMFPLDPASVSVLSYEREARCIQRWNVVPDPWR